MPSDPYDIETIERYLTHRMEGSERTAFEARLQQDEGFRQEVQAYRPVLEGLYALSSEGFRQRLSAWEEEWAQAGADDTELIEWYLSGELAGKARAALEERMEKDEAFAREVAAYRQAFQGFEASRTEAFRHRMEEWEKEENKKHPSRLRPERSRAAARRPLWPRIAAAAAILLLLGFSFNWYLQANYSAGAIIEDYYQPPLDEATMGEEPGAQEAVSQSLQAAHRLFQQQDYLAAYQAFDNLLAQLPAAPIDGLSRTYYREQSEWSRLLAAVRLSSGRNPPTPTPPLDVKAEARRIASIEGHEFREPAQELLRKLDSPWYGWVNDGMKE